MSAGDAWAAMLLGLVEGLTEFLPVSSTGHLIVAARLLGRSGEGIDATIVIIQFGAILAVCWHYRIRLGQLVLSLSSAQTQRFILRLAIAFFPAAVVGLAVHVQIKELLFNPLTVAGALIVGGVAIILIERRHITERVSSIDDMNMRDALWVGIAQILSLFPGVSRSAATIMGGRLTGLSRSAATEFSFFLAIPVIFAASLFDLWQNKSVLADENTAFIALAFGVSFLSALFAVRWLLGYVATRDFRPFGWYRIAVGILVALWFTLAPPA